MGKLSVLTGKINDIETDLYPVTIPQGVIDPSDKKPLSDDLPKIKDKVYDSANYSGLGRVYLEKNIVSDINILTQYMMPQNNTIYIVEWDFDLNGSEISIPDGCILEFKGGSFSNGTIVGNETKLSGNLTYSIFNDCVLKGFNVPYFDVRWFGGKADYDESTKTGTDNAVYFDRAIKACGQNRGAYVKVVGRYIISSTVTVKYDLNLVGEYHINRTFWDENGVDESGDNSMIYVPSGVTAFKVVGRGTTRKSANLSINNIKFVGAGLSQNPILIEFTATGAPPRVGKFAECLCTGFKKVLYFHDLGEYNYGTIYGNMTIEKVVSYSNSRFIEAKASGNLIPTLCNLVIRDSNIEWGESNAIYLENLFGANIIDNCLLEASPNVIYASIIGGSLDITNSYFESQGGEYMLKVVGKNVNNCYVTCTNNYRANQDKGLPYIFNSVKLVNFNTVAQQASDVKVNECWLDNDIISQITTEGFDTSMVSKNLNYYQAYPYGDNVGVLRFGNIRIENGLLGKKNITKSNASAVTINLPVVAGDSLLLCYYKSGSNHFPNLYNASGSPITNDNKVIYGPSGMVFVKYDVVADSNVVVVHIVPESETGSVTVGNGFIFKNLDVTNLSKLGICRQAYIDPSVDMNYQSQAGIRGIPVISENIFDGMFYSDGVNVRNSDGSLFSKSVIVSKYHRDSIFTRANTVYKIAGDIDLNGDTITIPAGSILDFNLGGTITNGTINLNNCLLHPFGLQTSKYISATLKGSYGDGQITYSPTEGKLLLRHDSKWINVDGSEITD